MENLNNLSKYLWDYDTMLSPRPKYIELDLTNYCNLDCEWCCSAKQHQQKPEYMSTDVFKRELQYAITYKCGIDFTGGGEPTLSPLFPLFVNLAKSEYDSFSLPSIALVTNGANLRMISLFLNSFTGSRSWVRISLNDREPSKNLLGLLEAYSGRIGISLIYGNEEQKQKCLKNAENPIIKKHAKFIRIRSAIDYSKKHETTTPYNCVGRKFAKIIEPNGIEAYCCQSRGYEGNPRYEDKCPQECRWANFSMKEFWEWNPFT